MNEKFLKSINYIKDILIIIFLPIFMIYGYRLYNDVLVLKNSEIEYLKTKIEFQQDYQVDNVWNKYKSLKEFTDSEIVELNNKVLQLNDSLKSISFNSIEKKEEVDNLIMTSSKKDSMIAKYYLLTKNQKSQINLLKEIINLKEMQIIKIKEICISMKKKNN